MADVARAEERAGTRPAAVHEEAKERGPANVFGLYKRLPIPATRDQLTGDGRKTAEDWKTMGSSATAHLRGNITGWHGIQRGEA